MSVLREIIMNDEKFYIVEAVPFDISLSSPILNIYREEYDGKAADTFLVDVVSESDIKANRKDFLKPFRKGELQIVPSSFYLSSGATGTFLTGMLIDSPTTIMSGIALAFVTGVAIFVRPTQNDKKRLEKFLFSRSALFKKSILRMITLNQRKRKERLIDESVLDSLENYPQKVQYLRAYFGSLDDSTVRKMITEYLEIQKESKKQGALKLAMEKHKGDTELLQEATDELNSIDERISELRKELDVHSQSIQKITNNSGLLNVLEEVRNEPLTLTR